MAFVRYKMVKGCKYYQLVRNYRENGKHRQQVRCHLGQHESLDAAIDYEKSMVSHHLRVVDAQEEEAASTKAYLFEFYGDRFTDKLPSLDEAYSAWDAFYEEYNANLYEFRDGFWCIKSSHLKGSFMDPEYDEFRQRWHRRQHHEEALLNSILEYYDEKADAIWHQVLADEHQAQLDKYLALKSAYG